MVKCPAVPLTVPVTSRTLVNAEVLADPIPIAGINEPSVCVWSPRATVVADPKSAASFNVE